MPPREERHIHQTSGDSVAGQAPRGQPGSVFPTQSPKFSRYRPTERYRRQEALSCMTSFADLHLSEPLLRALAEEGYTEPTPIQLGSIPHLLAGRDLLGLAQTGTGKTAAFALPILHRLAERRVQPQPRGARVLVLAPTRELASQIDDSFAAYARHMRLSHTVIFGGVGQGRQVEAIKRGVDVLVAAPGRLLDLMGQGYVDLSQLEVLVLE